MKRFVKIILSVILILGMVVAPLHQVDTVYAEEAQTNPMRAIWLRPKEINKKQVEDTVQKLADCGINTIYLESVYNGFTIFPVEYDYTYQNPMYGGFDVLGAYVEACHSRGMQIHAWVESFFIGMQRANSGGPVYKAKKDWLLTDRDGNNWEDTMYGKMYFLNPARPECREWIVGLYEIMVTNYDIDGVQLDYVRYPEKTKDKDYGFDDYTIKAFQEEKGVDFDPREVKQNSFEADVFAQYKRNQVTKFVEMCSTRLREIKPDLLLSLSVYPFYNDGVKNFMQSAEEWMKKGYGDLLFPMAYYENAVKNLTTQSIKVANDSPANTVIGISTQNNFTVESVKNQVQTVLDSGAGVAFFEYETFFSEGYADALKGTLLKDTQFNIDVDTYKTDVVRENSNQDDDSDDGSKNPLLGLNLSTTDLIIYGVLAVAVIAIVVEAIVLIKGSKKKKNDSE